MTNIADSTVVQDMQIMTLGTKGVPIQADWLQTVEVTTKDTDCGETGEILIGTDNAKIVLKQSTSDVQRQTQRALGIGFRRLERKGWPVPFK